MYSRRKENRVKREDRYMTARHAAARLGVTIGTLYSYVSRGMLRSESVAGKPRVRRYLKEDVVSLIERKEFRHNPSKAAARGLHWGNPVLESALTLINEGRLFYRGIDALQLAQTSTIEEVAALLWTGDPSQVGNLFIKKSIGLPPKIVTFLKGTALLGPVERCQLTLPIAASLDPAAYDLRPTAVAKTGAQILRLLLCAVLRCLPEGSIDTALVQTWIPTRRSAAPAIRAALILCADHELNVSAFTARCIASARATPYEVVIGALAAFRGLRHGGASDQVEVFFQEAEQTRQPREVFAKRLRLTGYLPGFGHPLYPDGDPRALMLMSLAETYGTRSAVESANRLIRAAQSVTGECPNLDFGLVTLARALDLPPESSMALFALGRTVGWIAHAIEQYADNQLIRPRARYVGPVSSVR
jgi:citrate synthase